MNLLLRRFYSNQRITMGVLMSYRDENVASPYRLECFTVEDGPENKKKVGHNRLAAGFYRVIKRKEDTPMTLYYRKRYGSTWDYHLCLEVDGSYPYLLPNRSHTDDKHCIEVGDMILNPQRAQVGMELQQRHCAYKQLYNDISTALKNGEEVWCEIVDQDRRID